MITLRDVVIFFAGFQFFHTIDHLIIPFYIKLPYDLGFMVLTPTINFWAIIINAFITLLLLWWAYKLSIKKSVKYKT